MDLRRNLQRLKDKYDVSWENLFYIDNLFVLDFFRIATVSTIKIHAHWMVMLDMGFLIVFAYNFVVVLLSS